nr:PREDICTED: dapper homolog 2 [Bos mutus]
MRHGHRVYSVVTLLPHACLCRNAGELRNAGRPAPQRAMLYAGCQARDGASWVVRWVRERKASPFSLCGGKGDRSRCSEGPEDRLRRQDVGLQTHLDQLDRQISALQLDVRRGPGETADSDSRPSSGFYELSDGGSCSLSTSCTSVCSDHVSCSLGTLLPAAPKARPGSGDCRPRSADETAVCGVPLPAWGPPASEEGPGQLFQEEPRGRCPQVRRARRWSRKERPLTPGAGSEPADVGASADVSGTVCPVTLSPTLLLAASLHLCRTRAETERDLERILPADVGLQKAGAHPTAAPFLCHGVDPKYQCDLVSRGGREVYPYPSPLHAVALQSPLFALARETPQSEGHAPPHPPPASPRARASSRLALPPVPRLCRVKASKALKRKIRRFQPAALKVMTMV